MGAKFFRVDLSPATEAKEKLVWMEVGEAATVDGYPLIQGSTEGATKGAVLAG